MRFTGKFLSVSKDWQTGKYQITFTVNEESALPEIDKLQEKKLSITAKIFRKHRSLDANGLLWHCIGQIASEMRLDKWDVYLLMLKRYGKYTYICVKPAVVEAVKLQWRECEEIGKVNINGQEAVQLLCYFGSSTYDSKEFSVLLDGVIEEMKAIGLQPPLTGDIRRALENYGQHFTGREKVLCLRLLYKFAVPPHFRRHCEPQEIRTARIESLAVLQSSYRAGRRTQAAGYDGLLPHERADGI